MTTTRGPFRMEFTDASIASLEGREKSYIAWDSLVVGLGCRVSPMGKRSFIVQGRVRGLRPAKQVKRTIGRHPLFKVDEARETASVLLREFFNGSCPPKFNGTTLGDYWPVYLEHNERRLSQATIRMYSSQWKLRVGPRFGTTRIVDITRGDIVEWSGAIMASGTVSMGRRAIACLSAVLSHAVVDGIIEESPSRNIPRGKTKPRAIRPSDEMVARLHIGLESIRDKHYMHYVLFKVLLRTGRRLRELLYLEWTHFDFSGGKVIYLSNVKGGGTLTVGIEQEATDLIQSLPRLERRIFAPKNRWAKELSIRPQWAKVRDAAGLPEIRIHDLRHVWASIAAEERGSLESVPRRLGISVGMAPTYAEPFTHAP